MRSFILSTALISLVAGQEDYSANPILEPSTTWLSAYGVGKLAEVTASYENASGADDAVRLLRLDLTGSNATERGRAHGYLLANEIREFFPALDVYFSQTAEVILCERPRYSRGPRAPPSRPAHRPGFLPSPARPLTARRGVSTPPY